MTLVCASSWEMNLVIMRLRGGRTESVLQTEQTLIAFVKNHADVTSYLICILNEKIIKDIIGFLDSSKLTDCKW